MKKTYCILMIAFMVTAMVACKKDKSDDGLKNDLVSFWELEQTSSMIPTQIYEPGNGNILRINADGTYSYSKDGQVSEQGNYTIVADNSVEENVCLINLKDKYKHRFEISNISGQFPIFSTSYKTFYYIADDKLYMIGGCFAVDGGVSRVYRRANPIAID